MVSQIIYRDIKFHIKMYMKFDNISNSVRFFLISGPELLKKLFVCAIIILIR